MYRARPSPPRLLQYKELMKKPVREHRRSGWKRCGRRGACDACIAIVVKTSGSCGQLRAESSYVLHHLYSLHWARKNGLRRPRSIRQSSTKRRTHAILQCRFHRDVRPSRPALAVCVLVLDLFQSIARLARPGCAQEQTRLCSRRLQCPVDQR